MPRMGRALPTTGVTGSVEVVLDPDVHRRVVPVVLDALAVGDLQARHVLLRDLQVRADIEAPPGRAPAEVVPIVVQVVPLDLPQHAGHLDVAPVARLAVVRREVREREAALHALERDVPRVDTLVGARPRPLERDHEVRVALLPRNPPQLHVAEEHHPVRPPVLDRVREDVGVHERAPGLARADLPQLAVRLPKAEGRLPGVDAGAEQLELEDRVDLPQAGGEVVLDPEAALADAGEVVAVRAELVLGRRAAWWDAPRRTSSGRSGGTGSPCRASPRRRSPSSASARAWPPCPARPRPPASGSAGSGAGLPSLDAARATAGAASASEAASSQPTPHRRLPVSLVLFTASSSSSCRLPRRRRVCPVHGRSLHAGLLPRPHFHPRRVEEPLVVARTQLLARLGRQLREERRVHVVDLQVLRLLGRRHLVRAEQEAVGIAVDQIGRDLRRLRASRRGTSPPRPRRCRCRGSAAPGSERPLERSRPGPSPGGRPGRGRSGPR